MDTAPLYGLGFVAGSVGLGVSFVRDLRRKRRGEPFRDSLGRKVYPGNPGYERHWQVAMQPYYMFFGIIVVLVLVLLYVWAKGLFGL